MPSPRIDVLLIALALVTGTPAQTENLTASGACLGTHRLLLKAPAAGAQAASPHPVCVDNNSPSKTIARCTEAINRGDSQSPANLAAAYMGRGQAYFFNGKVDDAIADFTQAIRLNPNPDGYTNRGAAYYEKGDMDRAKADWAEAKRLKAKKQ